MSHRRSCALIAGLAAAMPLGLTRADTIRYVYEGEVASISDPLDGTLWEGVSIGDPFAYEATIDLGAVPTDIQSVNSIRYAFAIVGYSITIGSLSDSGIPDAPQESFSGLGIVNNGSFGDLIGAYVDTPTYDIYGQINLDSATFDNAAIFATPGVYPPATNHQAFVALNDGFDGFIAFDLVSLTITPSPSTLAPLLAGLLVTSGRRRR